jgi:TolB-like protein
MNKKQFSAIALLFATAALSFAFPKREADAQTGDSKQPASSSANTAAASAYFSGSGGLGESIAVLVPEGRGLYDSEAYLSNLVQGVLISDFSKLSAMKVIDRQNIAKVIAEGESDLIAEDNNFVKAGEVLGADYFLNGTLQKSSSGFLLQINISEASTGISKAVYTVNCKAAELEDFTAVKKASEYLLTELGVELTDAGKKQLGMVVSDSDIDAELSLSRGLAAEQQGGSGIINVAARNYFFQAQDYEQTAKEASMRLQKMETQTDTDLGSYLTNKIASQRAWQITLNDYENFYTNHPPFDLYYTNPKEKDIDYGDVKTGRIPKLRLEFSVGLRSNPDSIKIMESVLKEIDTKLNATKNREEWGFNLWPRSLDLFGGPNTIHYDIEAVVENAKQQQLSRVSFTLDAGLNLENINIAADSMQEIPVTTPEITLYDGVDLQGLHIRILRVNKIDAEIAGRDGIIRIVQVEKMPKEQGASRLVASLAKKAEHEALPFYTRFGFSADGGYMTGPEIGTFGLGLSMGWGLLDLQAGVIVGTSNPAIYKEFEDAPNTDVTTTALDASLGLSFFGKGWLFAAGGGLQFWSTTITTNPDTSTEEETKEESVVPYLQARFEFGSTFAVRLGGRISFDAEELYSGTSIYAGLVWYYL